VLQAVPPNGDDLYNRSLHRARDLTEPIAGDRNRYLAGRLVQIRFRQVTVQSGVSVQILRKRLTLQVNGMQQFSATVNGSSNQNSHMERGWWQCKWEINCVGILYWPELAQPSCKSR